MATGSAKHSFWISFLFSMVVRTCEALDQAGPDEGGDRTWNTVEDRANLGAGAEMRRIEMTSDKTKGGEPDR
jgi:hypothetical protein